MKKSTATGTALTAKTKVSAGKAKAAKTTTKTTKKTTKTAKKTAAKPKKKAAPKKVAKIDFRTIFFAPNPNGPNVAQKLVSLVDSDKGRMYFPVSYFIQGDPVDTKKYSFSGNPRGFGTSLLTLDKMNEDQRYNYESIKEGGVHTELHVLVSDMEIHTSLLPKGVAESQVEKFGFAFALLTPNGNFRLRAVTLAAKSGGVMGEKDLNKILLPASFWNIDHDMTEADILGKTKAANTQNGYSTTERAYIFKRTTELLTKGNKPPSIAAVAQSLGVSRQYGTVMALVNEYPLVAKIMADKAMKKAGVSINYIKAAIGKFNTIAKEQNPQLSKKEIETIRNRMFTTSLASVVIWWNNNPEYRKSIEQKTTFTMPQIHLFALMGLRTDNIKEDNEARRQLGLPEIDVQAIEVATVETEPVKKDENGKVTFEVPETNIDGLGYNPNIAPSTRSTSAQYHLLLNLAIARSQKATLKESQLYLASIYTASQQPNFKIEVWLAKNVNSSAVALLNFAADEIDFAQKNGYMLPSNEIQTFVFKHDKKIESQHKSLESDKVVIEEAEIV